MITQTPLLEVGMTCHLGKGKTLWEVISFQGEHMVNLSALGKGGYSNRTAQLDELTKIEQTELEVTLGQVLEARAHATKTARWLQDRLRFALPNPEPLHQVIRDAEQTASRYSLIVQQHHADLLDAYGITPS
ncbi:hypothetical protein [Zhihengliuella flava]|uniref:Uncharacterized protein n=1 Tax=Zhihengliuella flava TaxID=1285193 RepID=A0A931D709_9MICC|nr:hypothetical protein [Zhihengliuella flava]MBG6083277.1 hypothetical protein [Zhihengliuella flava]